jgi:transcriptional regulator with XRE-family HTH domain
MAFWILSKKNMKTIGQKLKQARKNAGLSLMELGEKVGHSHVYISKIENGKNISLEVLNKIASGLDLDVEIGLIPKSPKKENN